MNDKPLRDWSRKELEEASNRARGHFGIGMGGGGTANSVNPIQPEWYEAELSRRETIKLAKWMTVAVMCNAVFIVADIVLRWVLR